MRRVVLGWALALLLGGSLWPDRIALAEAPAAATAGQTTTSDLRGFAPPMPDPQGEWSPVRIGEEALYRIVSKREMSQGPHLKVSEGLTGTQHLVVSQVPGEPIKVAARSVLREQGRADEVQEEAQYLRKDADGYRIVALDTAVAGPMRRIPLDPPALLLPNPIQKGMRWDAGFYDFEGLRYREEGEIVGRQAAKTPAGTYGDCLVVRHTGTLEGEVEMDGKTVRLKNGTVERMQWLARGVGPVLRKETLTATIVTRTGQHVKTRVVRQSALQGVRQGSVSPASAR